MRSESEFRKSSAPRHRAQEESMNNEPNSEPLSDQSWFVELLAGKGFEPASRGTFARGEAWIKIEGTQFSAYPGAGDHTWSGDFGEAESSTIKQILEQILKMQPFLSEADLAAERADKERLERA